MALVLVATVGAANANSFTTVAAADAYFDGRPFASAWTSATTGAKEQALVYASTILNQQRWKGARGTTTVLGQTQALAWPRRWAPTLESDAAPDFISEYFVDTTLGYYSELTIPTPIVQATCELALEILRAGTTDPFSKDDTRNIKTETVDVISTTYFDPGQRAYGLALFPTVANLIAPLLRSSGGIEVERV